MQHRVPAVWRGLGEGVRPGLMSCWPSPPDLSSPAPSAQLPCLCLPRKLLPWKGNELAALRKGIPGGPVDATQGPMRFFTAHWALPQSRSTEGVLSRPSTCCRPLRGQSWNPRTTPSSLHAKPCWPGRGRPGFCLCVTRGGVWLVWVIFLYCARPAR